MTASTALSPLQQAAERWPDAGALHWDDTHLSYRELALRARHIGAILKQAGIKRLGVIGRNSPEQVLLYWGCVEAGSLFCPLSWRFPKAQLEKLAGRLELDAIYYGNPQISRLGAIDEFSVTACPNTHAEANTPEPGLIDWQAPVNLVLTSGSSGEPKAALHSLANHMASATGSASLIPLELGDSWLLSLPLFHIGGLAILHRCVLAGACVAIPTERTLSDSLALLKPTHVSLVAAQLSELLGQAPERLSSVKALLLGGGAIPVSLLESVKALGIAAFSSYGMTEMSSQITTGPANSEGASGTLLPGRQLRIEDGEIQVRGDTLFLGYLTPNSIERPLTIDGWFATRDKGHLDADGRLFVAGRLDNMFVCGGENLQPEEVEAALCRHPAIAEALVFALADASFGNLPHAMLRLRQDSGTMPSQAELDAFLASHIARFKRPRRYFSWPESAWPESARPEIGSSGLKPNRKALIQALLAREGLNG